jgi:hypothetical protein
MKILVIRTSLVYQVHYFRQKIKILQYAEAEYQLVQEDIVY